VLDKTSHIFILTMLSVIIASLTFIIAMLATPRVKKN
jgi:hypothetical protein